MVVFLKPHLLLPSPQVPNTSKDLLGLIFPAAVTVWLVRTQCLCPGTQEFASHGSILSNHIRWYTGHPQQAAALPPQRAQHISTYPGPNSSPDLHTSTWISLTLNSLVFEVPWKGKTLNSTKSLQFLRKTKQKPHSPEHTCTWCKFGIWYTTAFCSFLLCLPANHLPFTPWSPTSFAFFFFFLLRRFWLKTENILSDK